MDKKNHELLLKSFDAALTSEEQARLNAALSASETLRLEQERIWRMRDAVGRGAARSFRPFFAERVIQRIQTTARENTESFSDSLMALFRPVLIAAAVLIAVMLSYNAVRHDGALMAGVLEQDVTLEEAFDPVYEWIEE